jgi:hypothetical protein
MKNKSDQQSVISRQPSSVSPQHLKAKPGVRAKGWSTLGLVTFFVFVGILLIAQSSLLIAANAPEKQEEKKTEVKAKAKTEAKTEERKKVRLLKGRDTEKRRRAAQGTKEGA